MVVDAISLLDQLGDSRTGPQVGGEAKRPGALQQTADQRPSLARVQLRRPARHRLGVQPGHTVAPILAQPSADALRRGLQDAGYPDRAVTLLAQGHRLPATLLQLLGASMWSHASWNRLSRCVNITFTGLNSPDISPTDLPACPPAGRRAGRQGSQRTQKFSYWGPLRGNRRGLQMNSLFYYGFLRQGPDRSP